jgi:protoporphyrinogen oxidase
MAEIKKIKSVTVIGAGFTGLTAAYQLAKKGFEVTVLEADDGVGGLASAFEVGSQKLDRFYHHWFTNDHEVMDLVNELGLTHRVRINPTNTGVYYANNFFKLSTPWDLLNFTPLRFIDRIRLGLLALRARRIKNWHTLENKTAQEWLKELGGENVYRVVWEPLLKGKFGPYAEQISAVWFWNKLKLRGGSRGKGGEERLAYFEGGFVELAKALASRIESLGGKVLLNQPVRAVRKRDNLWETVTPQQSFLSDTIIATVSLPLVADLIRDWADDAYIKKLERIHYLSNICLVLELDRPLSSTYWLNVNDPTFPFVGVIEHTNFESADNYDGRHIVYLSKYLPHTDKLYEMSKNEFLQFSIPFLQKMFPEFQGEWIIEHHLWRARWSQPVVEKHYSTLIPSETTPYEKFFICSMAQIYPEDRGTNYAIRSGRKISSLSEFD